MRAIDADALESDLFDADWTLDNDEHMVQDILRKQPTLDVALVRHAKWEYKCYPTIWYGLGEPPEWVCSECQDRTYDTYDYCPNCGARMDGEAE